MTSKRTYEYPAWHGPKTIKLSSGEVISRYDYHQLSSDTGYCPCEYCRKERKSS